MRLALVDYKDTPGWAIREIENIAKKASYPGLLKEIEVACSRSEAFLFIHDKSFCILKPVFDTEPGLLVWVAYSKEDGAIASYQSEIEHIAKSIGVNFLSLYTVIDKLEKVLTAQDWQRSGKDKQFTVWRKTL